MACWTSSSYVEWSTLIRSCHILLPRMTLHMLELAGEGHGACQRTARPSRTPILLWAPDLSRCLKRTPRCSSHPKDRQCSCIMKHQKWNWNLRTRSMSKMQWISAIERISQYTRLKSRQHRLLKNSKEPQKTKRFSKSRGKFFKESKMPWLINLCSHLLRSSNSVSKWIESGWSSSSCQNSARNQPRSRGIQESSFSRMMRVTSRTNSSSSMSWAPKISRMLGRWLWVLKGRTRWSKTRSVQEGNNKKKPSSMPNLQLI